MHTKKGMTRAAFIAIAAAAALSAAVSGGGARAAESGKDWRNLAQAVSEIPSEGYCDQPYAVVTGKGEWVVVMTTGKGEEGAPGQHVVATISRDRGRTWGGLIDVEPANGPEASWATPYLAPTGRLYVFYTYNEDNRREVLDANRKPIRRVDTLGAMMCRYSDDGGRTWSPQRHRVPIRNFQIDAANVYGGSTQFFWSVAKPIPHDGAVLLALAKVGNFGEGFMVSGSGAILRSANLATEPDPARIVWETLPDGDAGLLPPAGIVGDEHNLAALSDGGLYCIFRTNQGRPAHAYSRDGGRTWTTPEWATYAPGGPGIKQPRCFIKVHRFRNGKYALFFHNNGSRNYGNHPLGNRNPTWLAGGVERNGRIHWSQPEIFLYDDDQANGISYPDWIEDGGEYYFTETQKTRARVHRIPNAFLEMLWGQEERREVARQGLALEVRGAQCRPGAPVALPQLGRVSRGQGFSIEFRLALKAGQAAGSDQVLLDTRRTATSGTGSGAEYAGNGVRLTLLPGGALEVLLDDGRSPLRWETAAGALAAGGERHVVVSVDAAAKVLTLVVDGRLYDGGDRPFGYARFNPYLHDVNGERRVALPALQGVELRLLRVYTRSLGVSEAIGNWRSGG